MAREEQKQIAPNVVMLSGRVAADPEVRALPSGDELWTCRVIVARTDVRVLAGGRRGPSVDVIDLAAWTGRAQRAVKAWRQGDVIGVEGSLRRRFYRAGGQTASRMEVEVSSGRVLRRAASG